MDSQIEFKSNVFKHITATKKDFKFEKITELISLVDSLEFNDNKRYRIEYDEEVFEFTALIK